MQYIRWFDEIGMQDVPLVGGKNASLGEMVRTLAPTGVRIPNGFAETAQAYRAILDASLAGMALRDALTGQDADNMSDLAQRDARAREIITRAPWPATLRQRVLLAYERLRQQYGPSLTLAVRSSATAEDMPTASFAGQLDSFLNINGEEQLIDAISADYGLGENVVKGNIDPDDFFVFKPALVQGKRAVLRRALGSKKLVMVCRDGDTREPTTNVPTNRGGRTCHAAIVARELGIPAVIGAHNATDHIAVHEWVTVSCAQGDFGQVYAGQLPFDVERTNLASLPRPKAQVMLILGNPDIAFKTSMLPNNGVGLARMEFVISATIRAHPMALLHPERVQDAAERAQLAQLSRGYAKPADYFVERLAEGIGTIAAPPATRIRRMPKALIWNARQ